MGKQLDLEHFTPVMTVLFLNGEPLRVGQPAANSWLRHDFALEPHRKGREAEKGPTGPLLVPLGPLWYPQSPLSNGLTGDKRTQCGDSSAVP